MDLVDVPPFVGRALGRDEDERLEVLHFFDELRWAVFFDQGKVAAAFAGAVEKNQQWRPLGGWLFREPEPELDGTGGGSDFLSDLFPWNGVLGVGR